MSRPAKFQLVDLKLGGRLESLLNERRAPDPPASFDAIAMEVFSKTGVRVTGPTIRNWTLLIAAAEPSEGAA